MITYLNWTQLDSTLPGNLPCFSRVDCSPHVYKHHLKSFFLSSNLLAFSPFYSLFSEKTQTIWWKQPQFPANKSSNQPVSVPTVPTSFLLLFREGVSPPFKGCLFLYLRATPFCFLRTLSSSFLPSHSLIFNFFFSSAGPMSWKSCPQLSCHFFTSQLLHHPIKLSSRATPLHSSS